VVCVQPPLDELLWRGFECVTEGAARHVVQQDDAAARFLDAQDLARRARRAPRSPSHLCHAKHSAVSEKSALIAVGVRMHRV
jgi:hypothetical protein